MQSELSDNTIDMVHKIFPYTTSVRIHRGLHNIFPFTTYLRKQHLIWRNVLPYTTHNMIESLMQHVTKARTSSIIIIHFEDAGRAVNLACAFNFLGGILVDPGVSPDAL